MQHRNANWLSYCGNSEAQKILFQQSRFAASQRCASEVLTSLINLFHTFNLLQAIKHKTVLHNYSVNEFLTPETKGNYTPSYALQNAGKR